jgi:Putative transposase
VDAAVLHIGDVAFIHSFGSSLSEHVHSHVCVVNGLFEELASSTDADANNQPATRNPQPATRNPQSDFHPASGIDQTVVAKVQVALRCRILCAFVGRGLLESFEAKEMLSSQHNEPASDRRGIKVDE